MATATKSGNEWQPAVAAAGFCRKYSSRLSGTDLHGGPLPAVARFLLFGD